MKFLLKSKLLSSFSIIGLVVLVAMSGKAKSEVPVPSTAPQIIAKAVTLPLDHFLCYKTQGGSVNSPVRLQDQFDTQFLPFTVTTPFRFCNPVEKTHSGVVTPIKNPDGHLEMFRITTTVAAPTRLVQVENQFGIKRLRVFNPLFLAVPTRKLPHPAPTGLDHFKCYKATGNRINVPVNLKDQFQTQNSAAVLNPYLLCNPVVKVHNGVTTPILNPEAHLVCYRITIQPFVTTRQVVNQFGAAVLPMRDADTLCVPSLKKILT